MKKLIWILATGFVTLFSVVFGQSPFPETGQGSLYAFSEENGQQTYLEIPLKHTVVNAEISGFIARVDVRQEFFNSEDHPIEAIYVFPLPDNAAVDQMNMIIGTRVVKGVIKERSEAEMLYQQARHHGNTASLLTQERPNIFTQSITNIAPGDKITIAISYVQDITYDHGEYEFNFPMVVGPRFIPGNPIGKTGGGWALDTTDVPDASKITPPVLKPGMRSGHDIRILLDIDTGYPIKYIHSPSHNIMVESTDSYYAVVALQENDTVPNKDFILRYNIAGKSPESALLTHAGSNGGFFSLVIQPQADFDQGEITPKEMFFVVDCSGSMSGAPITKAKEAMKHAIANMNPEDSFQIIRFSSAASQFSPYPLSNTPQNIKKAMTYIDAMQGSGGTQMIEGIKASLDYPRDPQKLRFVLFMTDGYIGNETQILAAIESRLNNARLFSFGVGTSVNHYLLDRMAETGRGFVQYVRPDEDTEKAVNLFYERIRNPLLTDIFINWNGLNVQDVSPAAIPDLFSSQPVILHGRYGNPGKATIVIHGKIAGKPWYQEIDATLPEKQPRHDVLETLWARTRIKTLMSKMYDGPSNDIVKEITELGITYRIMSQYTAFIAVTEEIRCDADGNRQTVHIPVNLPEMVEYEGIFGECNEKKVCGRLSLPAAIPQQAPSGTLVSSSSELLSVKDEYDLEPIKYKENHNQNKPCKLPVRSVSFHCSMVSGQINSAEVISALEALSTEIDALLKSYPPGRLILVLNVNSKGKPSKVETIKNVYHDLSLEESLSKLLMSKLNLTSGNGQANITIIVS